MFLKALFTGALAAVFYYGYLELSKTPSNPPIVPEDVWWGARSRDVAKDNSIRPFSINVSDHDLQYLKNRLKNFKVSVAPLKGVNFEYGFNINHLNKIISHWSNSYDWRSREKLLNKLNQFKTLISGLDIHFIHVKQNDAIKKTHKVIPIILIHGWPGSVKEFYDLIPLLISPRKDSDYVFEVVAPSLPGYGYSEAAAYTGLGPAQMGVIFKKLMQKLGYKKFYIHGGDWGSVIGREMSILYPELILGYHSTMCGGLDNKGLFLYLIGNFWPSFSQSTGFDYNIYPISRFISLLWTEFGYFHLQSTKPDTVGVALSDSPVGLAAYILEKFSTWTDVSHRTMPDGGLTRKYSLDDLLDNIMVYWSSNCIITSMRLYSEYCSEPYASLGFNKYEVKVPTVCAQFPHELLTFPPFLIKRKFPKLVKISQFKDGGHFAAFEEPKLVADDIFSSIPLFVNASII